MSSFLTLLRKEMRALLPFIWLLLVLIAVDLLYICVTEFPDDYGLIRVVLAAQTRRPRTTSRSTASCSPSSPLPSPRGLLMRERAEDTLEFLDALPVSRIPGFLEQVFHRLVSAVDVGDPRRRALFRPSLLVARIAQSRTLSAILDLSTDHPAVDEFCLSEHRSRRLLYRTLSDCC